MNPTREELERLGCNIGYHYSQDLNGIRVAWRDANNPAVWFWCVEQIARFNYRPRFRVKAIGVE
jgi:hypothetical protein